MNMSIDDLEPILERFGWTVDSMSPFEISNIDGSKATGQAAHIVIRDILEINRDAFENLQESILQSISMFEEDTQKNVGCFLFIFNPQVEENQLLEISPTEYEFIPSDAQILAPSAPESITRLRYFNDDDTDDDKN